MIYPLVCNCRAAVPVVHAALSNCVDENADVVFPGLMWAEKTGHVTNLEGRRWKSAAHRVAAGCIAGVEGCDTTVRNAWGAV